MASGRLGRCIIGNRSGAEVYHNQSGKEVAVTLFAQSLSTTVNTEITAVVGVAATVLGNTVIIANSGSTGTYTSTTTFNFACAFCRCDDASSEYPAPSIGSTIQGAYRTWRCCCAVASDYKGAYPTGRAPTFISTEGNITDTCWSGCTCMCSNCCVPIMYGGNEIQSPAIWIDAQEPRVCWDTTHGPMYQSNVVGWFPNAWINGGMCCKSGRCEFPQSYSNLITQRQIGYGVTAAQRAAQFMANPACCCAQNDTWFMPNGGTNNTMPLQKWEGCSASDGCCCRGGSHEFAQGCRLIWRQDYQSFHVFMFFNYYALCNTPCWTGRSFNQGVRCCVTSSNCGDWCTCYDCGAGGCGWPGFSTNNGPYGISCGKYGSPMFWSIIWCGNCMCCCYGWVLQGNGYNTCAHCNSGECGNTRWQSDVNKCLNLCGCHNAARKLTRAVCRWTCLRNQSCKPHNCPSNTKRMSPYGFMYGMTNCMAMIFTEKIGTVQCYRMGFNDVCYWSQCWCQFSPCMYTSGYTIMIGDEGLSENTDEFAVKYMAFNPFDNYVYSAIRSTTAADCGIWRWDPHEIRRQHGPFCGCSGTACYCCGETCTQYEYNVGDSTWATIMAYDGGTGVEAWKRVATWPTIWSDPKYTKPGMCTSCLYRSEKCLWTMGVYNHSTKKWDGFTTPDLWKWTLSTDPLVQKINNTLNRSVSDDYRCVVEVCNCFFANMDCSGLLDYAVSANQYERTGVVLSNGDRVMVNNDGDIKTAVQVWGFEG